MTPLLSDIRVVELGAIVLGPCAGRILGDRGADVACRLGLDLESTGAMRDPTKAGGM